MIRPGAIVMTVLMSAVAVGVYFGLDHLPQDMVPGMGTQKVPDAAEPAAEAPQLDNAGTAMATAQVDLVASGVEDPAAAGDQSAVVTEEDLAEEPAAPEAAPVMASSSPSAESTVDYDPAPGGTGIPVEEPVATTAPEPEPEPEPKSEPAPAAAEPVAPAPQAPAATRKTVETPARQPASKPVSTASTAPANEPQRQPVAKNPQADVIKPWWPDPATIPVNQLKLQYAGQVQNEQAVALLFSAPLNLDTLRQHASILDSVGNPVQAGQWELAKNTRMAVLRGIDPGRYTVILAPAIADTKGILLGMTLQGPVYIQAQ